MNKREKDLYPNADNRMQREVQTAEPGAARCQNQITSPSYKCKRESEKSDLKNQMQREKKKNSINIL